MVYQIQTDVYVLLHESGAERALNYTNDHHPELDIFLKVRHFNSY
jgi:hypothetical protein